MLPVYFKELRGLFHSMIAPIYLAATSAIIGFYFMAQNMSNGYPLFSASLLNAFFVLIITVPLLTMRSFAEERNTKTDQLLFTSPLSLSAIVMGKFLAITTVFLLPLLLFSLCPMIIARYGDAYFAVDYTFLLVYLLVGMLFIAVGLLISTLTENQVIAAVGSFCALLILYLLYILADYVPGDATGAMMAVVVVAVLVAFWVYSATKSILVAAGTGILGVAAAVGVYFLSPGLYENLLPEVIKALSVMDLLRNIVDARLVDVAGLVRVVVCTAVLLFLTGQSLQKRRWS